jgi:hypothetical protein
MIIDTHVHAYPTSSDSHITLEEIVARAQIIGLDGVCITDHDSLEIRDKARAYSKETGFPVFVGAEVFTLEGDIIVFGLDELPPHRVHAEYLLHLLSRAGGVAISAHPFRTNNRGMGDLIRQVPGLDGIEAFNGSTDRDNNLRAVNLADELGLPMLGASDAHKLEAMGKFATVFPDGMRDEQDLIRAIKQGRVYPVEYSTTGFKKINTRELLGV